MGAKLVIDLARCDLQQNSGVQCSYRQHPQNTGINALLEKIRFALICRRCEGAPCVSACPNKALEKVPSDKNDAGILKRAEMLCTGCGTCAIACPFGTIYTDLIPYLSSVCDLCEGRMGPSGKPMCAETCKDGSIEYREVKEDEPDIIEVFDRVVVKVSGGVRWEPLLEREKE